ncbi:hypothetical protein BYT27DRAFT_7213632 [Phlegmacium glaucopus]|nr:hypothetical protein BYT27DRAFT_7213632 [Phlegmacium glaucopus]
MAAKFTKEEDHAHLRYLGCQPQGDEKKQRREHVEFQEERCTVKLAKHAKRQQTTKNNLNWLAFTALKGLALKDQLKVYQLAGAPNLQHMKQSTKLKEIRQGLRDAVDLYEKGELKIEQGLSNNDSDSGEDFDFRVPIDDDGNIDWNTDND